MGNDEVACSNCKHCSLFQSTFPRGERLIEKVLKGTQKYFNPRSRVGNDVYVSEPLCRIYISIHVPAWGTTGRLVPDRPTLTNFNPRSRVGNDSLKMLGAKTIEISIHVPAWGTTNMYKNTRKQDRYFNPRSRVGNDNAIFCNIFSYVNFNPRSRVGNDKVFPYLHRYHYKFQSTFPRGERLPTLSQIFAQVMDFNPRSRVGNDWLAVIML